MPARATTSPSPAFLGRGTVSDEAVADFAMPSMATDQADHEALCSAIDQQGLAVVADDLA